MACAGAEELQKNLADNGDIPGVKAVLRSRRDGFGGEMPGITSLPSRNGAVTQLAHLWGARPHLGHPRESFAFVFAQGDFKPSGPEGFQSRLQPGCPRHSSGTSLPLILCSWNHQLCWDLSHRQIRPPRVSCVRDGPECSKSWYRITAQQLCSSDTRGEIKHPRARPKTQKD